MPHLGLGWTIVTMSAPGPSLWSSVVLKSYSRCRVSIANVQPDTQDRVNRLAQKGHTVRMKVFSQSAILLGC